MNAAHRTSKQTPKVQSSVPEPRTSGEAVLSKTGRERDQWFALLDAWGATSRKHGEIAAWLMSEHGVHGWWAQSLTVDYEQARGLRPAGGSRDGTLSVNASKTIAVPVDRLFKAFVDARQRRRWLADAHLHERVSQPGRSARFDWKDGATRVIVGFSAKDADKSLVALSHDRLPNARTAEQLRAFWRERLTALKTRLEA